MSSSRSSSSACRPSACTRKEGTVRLSRLLPALQEEADAHDHLDVHWFPHTDRAMIKRNDRVDRGEGPPPLPAWRARLDDDLLANRLYEQINRAVASDLRRPASSTGSRPSVLGSREYADDSWKVFCSSRDVRFIEMEYAVPRASAEAVVRELRAWFDRTREPVPFPVELRFTGADDVWFSTAFQRENAYVAVHQYHRMDPRAMFAAFEAIVAEHEGRPHWGKVHTLGADAAARAVPAVRRVPGRPRPGRPPAPLHQRPRPPPPRRLTRTRFDQQVTSQVHALHGGVRPGLGSGRRGGEARWPDEQVTFPAAASEVGRHRRLAPPPRHLPRDARAARPVASDDPAAGGPCGLTTTGRRSGQPRAVILGYVEDGPNLVTLAMNGWGEGEPAWWLNLLADPEAGAVLAGGSLGSAGGPPPATERERLWQRWREIDEDLDAFAARRSGETAVVVLEPAGPRSD